MHPPFHFARRSSGVRWHLLMLALAMLMTGLIAVTDHPAQAATDAAAFPYLYWTTPNSIQFSTDGSTV